MALQTPNAGERFLKKQASLYFHLSVSEASLIDAQRKAIKLLENFRDMVKQNPNLYRDLIVAADGDKSDVDFDM